MPENPPFTVYRDQLTSLYHGLALWKPNPPEAIGDPPRAIYDKVSIGDVGYVREGAFIRMFNVILPWDHESNRILGEPVPYEPLSCGGPFANILGDPFEKGEYCSRSVYAKTNAGNNQATEPDDDEGVTYKCHSRGALLSLPHGGHRKDIIRKKAFEDYIKNHVVSWFTWTQDNQLGVERIEELILVSGCTLATSWAVVAFVDNTMEAEISLASRTLGENSGASFIWRNMRGPVRYNYSRFDPQNPPTTPDQCVFIRGFRAKRVLFWTKPMQAAAEPPPDDPDSRRDDEIQVSEVPEVPKYRDPVIGVLDYIGEKCLEDTMISEDIIAIAHDDDLKPINGTETLTADAVEKFLREKQMPLRVENGVRKLLHPIPFEAPQLREQPLLPHGGPSLYQKAGGVAPKDPVPPHEVDPQLWPWFNSVDKDRSGSITVTELQMALTNGDWTFLGLDTVKLLMYIFDTDRSRTIDFDEFAGLWKYIEGRHDAFCHFDRGRSGTINGQELQSALNQFGHRLSPQILNLLQRKYGSAPGPAAVKGYPAVAQPRLTFDRFLHACVAVKHLNESFSSLDDNRDGWIQLSYETFMEIALLLS